MFLLYALACLREPETVRVVVAARDLSVGVPIGPDDVYGYAMEPRFLPEGTVFSDPAEVLGRVPYERILANEPIRAGRLANAELQQKLEALVPRDHHVVVFGLADDSARAPIPTVDRVEVRAGGRVVVTDLGVLRVDGNQVAVIASAEQLAAIEAARPNQVLVVDVVP